MSLLDRLRGVLGLGEEDQPCGVCGRAPADWVYSSRYGPVSHAACEACAAQAAEPMYMLCFHIHRVGGPERAGDRFAEARSFHGGRYVGLAEILAAYPEFADEFDDGS